MHAKKVISETSTVINEATKVKQYLDEKARKTLMESQVLSKVKYSAPILAGESEEIRTKIYKVIHRAA